MINSSRPEGTNNEASLLPNRTWVEIDKELQKAMYVAIESLKMLRRFNLDPRQSTQIQAEITTVSQWMEFLMQQREHAAIEAAEQKPDLVKLVVRVLCDACRQNAKHKRCRANPPQDSAPPIWKRQLEFLFACTNRVGTELFAQGCASYNLKTFPACLTKLRNALLRQWRYLSPAGAGATDTEVEYRFFNACEECGQSLQPASESVS